MSDSSTFPFEKIIQSRSTNSGGGVKRWSLVADADANMYLNRHDSTGALAEVAVTFDATNGTIRFATDTLAPATDAVPTIVAGTRRVLLNTTNGTKVILTDTSGTDAVQEGQIVTLLVEATASGGAYTLALTGGASFDLVTLDAVGENVTVMRVGSGWMAIGSGGGASFS